MNEPVHKYVAKAKDDFDNELQHRIFSKAIPYVITGMVSVLTLGGTYFLGTMWSITTRLDRECPITHTDIAALKSNIAEIREDFAEYPRVYELRAGIDKATAAAEYRGADSVAMDEFKRRLEELKSEVRENRARLTVPFQYNYDHPPVNNPGKAKE